MTDDHGRAAQQAPEQERVQADLQELTQHGHLSLLAVVAVTTADGSARKRALYDRYTDLCAHAGIDQLAQRAIHNHLSDLRMLGILTADESRGGSRGNYYEYELAVPLQAAVDALDEELALGGVIAGVRDRTPPE